MTSILGISAFYHDSAAALVVDGEIIAAAQEERFSRIKHDHRFPAQSIDYCLRAAKLRPEDLDYVGFYDKPLLKFERLLETYLAGVPRGFRSFLMAMPLWLRQKLYLSRDIYHGLKGGYRKRIVYSEHHESHAASAFFPSPFEEAAILTVDGVGEWATASFGSGRGNRIELTHELRFPHSLGLLYSAFTYFCGFKVNSGEYKLMGLAPYGEPRYADVIRSKLVDIKPDGSFRMDMSYFAYCHGLLMTSSKFDHLFGGPPRAAESPLTEREMDLAASVQVVTEEILLRMAAHVHRVTGQHKLCLAGGVALNCVANGRLSREGPFSDIWIQPAAGDAGGALGVALFIWHQLLDRSRISSGSDKQKGSLLGPEYSDAEVVEALDKVGAKYRVFDNDSDFCDAVADQIARENVVGWFQGRMEFGPRALGSRSILGDARSPAMQSQMNLRIKFRESFRPFAPAVLEESIDEFFETRPHEQSPYMLLVAPVRPEHRLTVNGTAQALRGLDRLTQPQSDIPAVTHVDGSARIQTVDAARHGRFHQLLIKFKELTGCPLLINTSFNVRGEPIVLTPANAYRCFLATNIDALAIGRCLLMKSDQPAIKPEAVDQYLNQFQLD
jgi:carbamoyltransferase